MLKLNARGLRWSELAPPDGQWILRVTEDPYFAAPLRDRACLLAKEPLQERPQHFPIILDPKNNASQHSDAIPVLQLPEDLSYLADGDVVRIRHDGDFAVLFRREATSNSLLVTQRCNSFCVMCSQPPRDEDDSFLVDELEAAIPLFDRGTREIGITGGEPTLLGQRFLDLVQTLKSWLPETAVHVLTNGRILEDIRFTQNIARISHPDLMLGIPLYADIASEHDFIVQARGAFDQTIRGILNAKRCGLRVELRVVIHALNHAYLERLAYFIGRNLQFVDQVALMGLEPVGFAKSNFDALFIDPLDYQDELTAATESLKRAGIRVSIYNHQLCVIPETLWPNAVQSISDWKNEYRPECDTCSQRHSCGGFFSSSLNRASRGIHPI